MVSLFLETCAYANNHAYMAGLFYLSSSEGKAWNILTWTGLEPLAQSSGHNFLGLSFTTAYVA